MTTVLDPPATALAAVRPAARPRARCRWCASSADAPHPAAASATCEECLGPLEPVYDAAPRPARRGHDRRPPALALALPRVAPVRGRARRLARHRLHPAARRAGAGPPARRRARLGQERRRLPSLAQLQGPGRRHRAQRRARPRASTRWAAPRPATWPTRSRRRPRARACRPGSSSRTTSSSARWWARRSTTRIWSACAAPTTTSTASARRWPTGSAGDSSTSTCAATTARARRPMAFEIAEQLGWRLPTAVVAPMAGGSLLTKLDKGFREFGEAGLVSGPAPRLYGAQASGCAPIVRLVESGGEQRGAGGARTPSRARSRSATRRTAASPRRRSAAPAAGPPASRRPRWSTGSGCSPRPPACSPRPRAA